MAATLPAAHSAAFLSVSGSHRRLPRAPKRQRPPAFWQAYEDRALVYDCFWSVAPGEVLLVGPPPLNLAALWRAARFTALPSGLALKPGFHASASVMLTALRNVPPGSTAIRLDFDGQSFELTIQPSSGAALAGKRVMSTMSRNNDLAWIAEWARYHQRVHGVAAVLLFDNGSTRYEPAEITATLAAVPGLSAIAVQSWPYRYGAPDPAIHNNPYYTLFLQMGALSVALRRYTPLAAGLLNNDVDELMTTSSDRSLFDELSASRKGLVVMRGQYVEALPADGAGEALVHRDFPYRLRDPKARACSQKKWVLDPRQPWVSDLSVHPYMHWIEGRPWRAKTQRAELFYWHFRGISTNWKDQRADISGLDRADLEPDPLLSRTYATISRD